MTDFPTATPGKGSGSRPHGPAADAVSADASSGQEPADDSRIVYRPAALDPDIRLHLRDLAGIAVARGSMWQLALTSRDQERIAAARPAIRNLLDAELITTAQHDQRVRALESDDDTAACKVQW